jgi:hypothetical protein
MTKPAGTVANSSATCFNPSKQVGKDFARNPVVGWSPRELDAK